MISAISHHFKALGRRTLVTGMKPLGRGHGKLSHCMFVASRSLYSVGELSVASSTQWV